MSSQSGRESYSSENRRSSLLLNKLQPDQSIGVNGTKEVILSTLGNFKGGIQNKCQNHYSVIYINRYKRPFSMIKSDRHF